MNDWTLAYLDDGILLSNKRKQTLVTCNNFDGSQGHYAEWKKSILKCYILYCTIYITFSKWQNYKNGEQISGHQGLGQYKVFLCGDGTVLYLIVVVVTQIYADDRVV